MLATLTHSDRLSSLGLGLYDVRAYVPGFPMSFDFIRFNIFYYERFNFSGSMRVWVRASLTPSPVNQLSAAMSTPPPPRPKFHLKNCLFKSVYFKIGIFNFYVQTSKSYLKP